MSDSQAPICFVLIPTGRKRDAAGREINFDAVYENWVAPAVRDAELTPLRGNSERRAADGARVVFEQFVLSDYSVVDLTTANAQIAYEIGSRRAVRPGTTIVVFAEGAGQIAIDASLLDGLPYKLGPDGGPADLVASKSALTSRLTQVRSRSIDESVFQLLDDFPEIQRLKTDVFWERIQYDQTVKEKLAAARKAGLSAVRSVEQEIGEIAHTEAGVAVDLLLSYRELKAWNEMIGIVGRMAEPLRATVLVQEQFAFALNRGGRPEDAEQVLRAVLEKRGPSSETFALLGRVYKDRWEKAGKDGNLDLAGEMLRKAIDAYVSGFEADWRDAYPGINAVTLMEISDPPDPRRTKLLPVVTYSVERRLTDRKSDYWDHATRLELAVLAADESAARSALANALAATRASWEPETTARNVRLIREARERRGRAEGWLGEIEKALIARANSELI